MARLNPVSKTAHDPRQWTTFWSTIDSQGCRYRHQVKMLRTTREWFTRTEIWEEGMPLYYSRSRSVSDETAVRMRSMRFSWSNVDEEGRPLYPPEFSGGFPIEDMHDRD